MDDENAIFGECKWKNEPVGIVVLNELIEKSKLFKQYKNKYYMLFSKSGFTRELEETAVKMGNVELVNLRRIYEEI